MNKHIHIRDFDAGLHKVLATRAKSNNQSLSQYLRQELTLLAKRPTLEQVLNELIELPRMNVTRQQVAKAMREGRKEQDAKFDRLYGFAEDEKS